MPSDGMVCMFSWALYSCFVGEQRCGGWRGWTGSRLSYCSEVGGGKPRFRGEGWGWG